MSKEEELAEFAIVFRGDKDAASLAFDILRATGIADKFADGQEATQRDMAEMLDILMVKIPTNPFYEKYKMSLIPILANGIACWDAANRWMDGNQIDKEIAFGYARHIESIVYWIAYISGGAEAAADAVDMMHSMFHDENINEWLASNGALKEN